MTVNLTRIYTRLGDDGKTHLGDMSRVPKTDARVEAYGAVDELNASIGLALALEDVRDDVRQWLTRIQNDLFDVGADLSVPLDDPRERLRVTPTRTEWLEQRCDEVNAGLAPLKSFVLPGGTLLAAPPHLSPPLRRPPPPPRRRPRRARGPPHNRADQPGDGALPEPPLGPPVHPRARCGGRA